MSKYIIEVVDGLFVELNESITDDIDEALLFENKEYAEAKASDLMNENEDYNCKIHEVNIVIKK